MALCGLLAYSGLFPGHIVSQLVTDLGEHGFVIGAMAGCHDEGGTAKPAAYQRREEALSVLHGLRFIPARGRRIAYDPPSAEIVGGDVLAIEDDMALRKSAITPQSRGPPLLSA